MTVELKPGQKRIPTVVTFLDIDAKPAALPPPLPKGALLEPGTLAMAADFAAAG